MKHPYRQVSDLKKTTALLNRLHDKLESIQTEI